MGDYQNIVFKDKPENKGKIMTQGLWRYTRHPNYFGEVVMWWGLYIVACGTPEGWKTFFGPLFIHLLLLFVSGVALTERYQKKKPEFRVYMKETNAFIPWFYTEVKDTERPILVEKYRDQIEDENRKREEKKAQRKAELK